MTTTLANTYSLIDSAAIPAVSGMGSYVNAVNKYPVLTEEQELELVKDLRENGNRKAALALIYTHLRQVVGIVRNYRGYGLPEMDLVQEGNIGLMKAVAKYDPEQKARLSTYATYWIKAAINDYVISNWKIVKVATSAAQRKLFYNLRRMTKDMGTRLGIVDAKAIAAKLDVKTSEVLEMEKRLNLHDQAYDPNPARASDEYDNSPSATQAADDGAHAELIVIEGDTKRRQLELLENAMASLPERERKIVEARQLSPSGKDVKLHELSDMLGISSERVRQLEAKAMDKIKKHVLAHAVA